MPAAASRTSSRASPAAPRRANSAPPVQPGRTVKLSLTTSHEDRSVMLVSVNQSWRTLSGDFLIAALDDLLASVIAFAGDFAFGRPRRAAAVRAPPAHSRQRGRQPRTTCGRGQAAECERGRRGGRARPGGQRDSPGRRRGHRRARGSGGAGRSVRPDRCPRGRRPASALAIGQAGAWVRAAVALSALGAAAHLVAVVARGLRGAPRALGQHVRVRHRADLRGGPVLPVRAWSATGPGRWASS